MVRTRGKETTTESEELCPSVLSCCGCGKRVCPMGGVRAGARRVLGGADLDLPFWKCHQPFVTWELRQKSRNIVHEGRSCSPARLLLPAQSKGKLETPTEPLCVGQHWQTSASSSGISQGFLQECLCLELLRTGCAQGSAGGCSGTRAVWVPGKRDAPALDTLHILLGHLVCS